MMTQLPEEQASPAGGSTAVPPQVKPSGQERAGELRIIRYGDRDVVALDVADDDSWRYYVGPRGRRGRPGGRWFSGNDDGWAQAWATFARLEPGHAAAYVRGLGLNPEHGDTRAELDPGVGAAGPVAGSAPGASLSGSNAAGSYAMPVSGAEPMSPQAMIATGLGLGIVAGILWGVAVFEASDGAWVVFLLAWVSFLAATLFSSVGVIALGVKIGMREHRRQFDR